MLHAQSCLVCTTLSLAARFTILHKYYNSIAISIMIHQLEETLSAGLSDQCSFPSPLPVIGSPSKTDIAGPRAESDRPLLLVKITGYRLFSTAFIIASAAAKVTPSFNVPILASMWSDWVVFMVVGGLFLLSLYEGVRPKPTHWFFHDDLTLDLILWPAGFFLITSGVAACLTILLAIGLNLAALACLLPITPKTYTMLIFPIVILADALTAAFLFALYYSMGRIRRVFAPLVRRYKHRRDVHPVAYSLPLQIGVTLLGCVSLLLLVEAFCIDNRSSEICAWPCRLMIPALSKRAQVSCAFPKPSPIISPLPVHSQPIDLSSWAAPAEPAAGKPYAVFIASRVIIVVVLFVYLYSSNRE